MVFDENAFVGAFSPDPNTEPGVLVDTFPPGPKTDPDGLAAVEFVDALPPGPKRDPAFVVENAGTPNADPVADCDVPNAEGCANAELVASCAGAPKADVPVSAFPNEDCPNTDPPDPAGVVPVPDPKADGCAKAEKPPLDGELPLPNGEAPDPANALKAPPLEDEPKAPGAGLIVDVSDNDVCPNADVCCGWPNADVVAGAAGGLAVWEDVN